VHYFELRNIQHFILYLLPALISVLLVAVAFGYLHFRSKDSEERKKRIIESYIGGIEGRNAPFPLVLILILAGTIIWAFFYILMTGLQGVKI
jgi:membrane protease YdiL (CAAX protease family)